ncbi:helix-turn-helix domain-containing protein [Blastococcus sp. Marseille-P5729]|uniref:helix-turn-helix domain-containing protein n=1 Tax=Blastococcus sp. Marseille-P5729 TaxID=2086582 RepID=UPI000D1008F8|nr:helix-turn-helix transcriptional regulator [Blastococcus sp. Marseille-P5729]
MPTLSDPIEGLGAFIRTQREQAKVSLRQLAELADVSNPYLSQIERGLRRPSAEILAQIAKGLRISAETLYVRAGLLEPSEGGGDVVAAIRGDERLNDRQKQALIEVYQSFCEHDDSSDTNRQGDTG